MRRSTRTLIDITIESVNRFIKGSKGIDEKCVALMLIRLLDDRIGCNTKPFLEIRWVN